MNKTRIKCNIFDKIKTMEFSKKDLKYIILLFVCFVLSILITYGNITNVYMDIGREFYFPASIINGEVLYRDIFNIFGPFSYMFNSLLYKMFGINFSVLYNFAVLNSFIIILLTYVISKKFLNRFCSFVISLLCLFAGCHSLGFSTFLLPYTYAIAYGTTFSLTCIYLFLRFLDTDKKKFLYCSFLMSGFALANKYEFLVLPAVLFLTLFLYKRQTIKTYLTSFLLTILPFILLFGVLFIQGLKFSDLISYTHLLLAYAKSLPLKILYINIGVYPSLISLKESLISVVSLVLSLGLLFSCFKVKNPILKILSVICSFIVVFIADIFISLQTLFAAITLINIVFIIIFVKKLALRLDVIFLAACTILLSLKSFWKMIAFGGYGLFVINLNLILFVYILYEFVFGEEENKKAFLNAFCTNLFVTMFLVLCVNFNVLSQTKHQVVTKNASFYTTLSMKQEFDEIVSFLQNNVKKDEKVIILPEGLLMNFAADAKSDNYYNIFTPDRVDAYSEKGIIEHYKKTKPDYFILVDSDYLLYGTRYICRDFAQGLCRFITENYKLEKAVKYENSLLMFRKI